MEFALGIGDQHQASCNDVSLQNNPQHEKVIYFRLTGVYFDPIFIIMACQLFILLILKINLKL